MTHLHLADICQHKMLRLAQSHFNQLLQEIYHRRCRNGGCVRIFGDSLAEYPHRFTECPPESEFDVHCWRMAPTIEKISAVTFRVMNMDASVQFYRNVLGMELVYGGERASFSSLRANNSESAILNLEQGDSVSQWGRLIFHVADVDAFWTHLKEKGLDPESPRDASWGERYFHVLDPDGHELSFARQLQ